jgi:hypothetical protein
MYFGHGEPNREFVGRCTVAASIKWSRFESASTKQFEDGVAKIFMWSRRLKIQQLQEVLKRLSSVRAKPRKLD